MARARVDAWDPAEIPQP